MLMQLSFFKNMHTDSDRTHLMQQAFLFQFLLVFLFYVRLGSPLELSISSVCFNFIIRQHPHLYTMHVKAHSWAEDHRHGHDVGMVAHAGLDGILRKLSFGFSRGGGGADGSVNENALERDVKALAARGLGRR